MITYRRSTENLAPKTKNGVTERLDARFSVIGELCRPGGKKQCLGFFRKLGGADEYISPFCAAPLEDLNLCVFSVLDHCKNVILLLSNSFSSCKFLYYFCYRKVLSC